MSRIRSVHPGLFTDEAFMSASMAARVLLVGLWTECDDNGIFEWKPIRLKMRILPADNFDVGLLLDELKALDVVKKFTDDGGRLLGGVRNFCKWQRPKSPQTAYYLDDEMAVYTAASARDAVANERPERGTALGKILLARQDDCCHYCGVGITFYRKKPNSLEIDHRVPISRGGSDDIANLVATCRPCNSLKANLTDDEFKGKFAPSELLERHMSLYPNMFSQIPTIDSRLPKVVSGKIRPQMEDGEESSTVSELRSSTAPKPALDPLDLKRELWASGKRLLAKHGKSEAQAGALIGKWCKTHSHGAVLDALARADAACPGGDVVAYIEGIFGNAVADGDTEPEVAGEADLVWRAILTSWLKRGRSGWPEGKGFPPGRYGCQVPEPLLREFGLLEGASA